ncbi:MAG: NTP transferase domain-containing protein [Candidatus Eiseniibacteriota bacterium]
MKETATAVILAAGEGKRMASDLAKVLHPLAGRPLLEYVLDACEKAGLPRAVVVVGSRREQVIDYLKLRNQQTRGPMEVRWAVQAEQKGTGHALKMALPVVEEKPADELVVLCGDAPLIRAETIRELLALQRGQHAAVTILTADLEDPGGYGRVIRTKHGDVERIVEHRDATEEERRVPEINSADYVFDRADVTKALDLVRDDNRQGEYYLTDTIAILKSWGRKVLAHKVPDAREVLGVNTVGQLAEAEDAWNERVGGA